MLGFPPWATAISAVVVGLGGIWLLRSFFQRAEADRVRRASLEAKEDGDARAKETEAKLKQARDEAVGQDHADDSW